jgi:prepilin-type N-terminal cleavage/methylation domain-containing protein
MGPFQSRPQALARAGGFTLIELLVVVCVVALLFAIALDRLLRYQELAERTAVELNLAAINIALTSKFAALIAKGRGDLIEAEVGANPVNLLLRPPENYLGELYSPGQAQLIPRSWYYDPGSGDLVYVANRNRYLSISGQPSDRLRFGIVLSSSSPTNSGIRELRQPFITSRQPYRWVIE